MTRNPGTGRAARAIATTTSVLALACLYACAPKITKVDTAYTMPEGVSSPNATMIVWRDQPTTVYFYEIKGLSDPDQFDKFLTDPEAPDSLTAAETHERYSPNVLHGLIIDKTDADAYQLFRREPGGGVRQFTDYTAPRTRQWVQTQTEAFHFIDLSPSGYAPATYVARGVVEGVVNSASPLTNLATLSLPPLQNIDAKAVWWNNTKPGSGPVFHGSKLKLNWSTIPGADQYLIQVYEFRSDLHTDEERTLSGVPAPIYDGQSRDVFVGIVPSTVNLLFVGDSSRTDVKTLVFRGLANGAAYMTRITALDASGHMIGLTIGDPDPLRALQKFNMLVTRGVRGVNSYELVRPCATVAKDTVRTGGGGGGGGGLG
jgi:hypothetical protein